MSDLLQIILAAVSSGTLTGWLASLITRRATLRKADAEADQVVAANETVRLTTYQNIIADLDQRIAATMSSMRELESEILQLRADNRALRQEIDRLKAESQALRQEIDRLRKENQELLAGQESHGQRPKQTTTP